jgi:hypothetical protein
MEKFILNGMTIKRKSIFHEYDIFSEQGCWLNTFRDLIDVQKFCKHPHKEFIRLGEYEKEERC